MNYIKLENDELNQQQYNFTDHETQTLPCIYCGKEFTKKSVLDAHTNLLSGDCLEQPVECPYKVSGCKINDTNSMDTENKVIIRKNLDAHLNANQAEHLKLVFNHLTHRLSNLEITSKNFNETNNDQPQEQSDSENTFDEYKFRTDSGYSGSRPDSFENKRTSLSCSNVSSELDSFETKPAETNSKIDSLEKKQYKIMNDITKIDVSNENLIQQVKKYKEENNDLKTLCQDLHKALSLAQISLLTLEERLINQEKLSYNGTLLWKITNVQERIQEAKSGRQTCFYSPPFYTERNGFKMCGKIYLNGDGDERDAHLSLFFVILRGEYDVLLKWPFRKKVTFILIDQSSSGQKKNIYDFFKPDLNSSSFRRPTSEMNVAFGLSKFCLLNTLVSDENEYIKDNTMFIKIKVATE